MNYYITAEANYEKLTHPNYSIHPQDRMPHSISLKFSWDNKINTYVVVVNYYYLR